MPTNNHVLLQRVVLSETSASISIANLPQTGYKHLRVLLSGRADEGNGGYQNGFWLTFNGASTQFTQHWIQYEATSTIGSANANYFGRNDAIPLGGAMPSDFTSNAYGSTEFWIPNYTSGNSKPVMSEGTLSTLGGVGSIMMTSGLWSNASAIHTITVDAYSNGNLAANFVQGTTVSVYGIAGEPAISPYATGGDIITRDSTYYYHAFLKSGLFTPLKNLTASVLVIAGGGGAGQNGGGGGGAGGVLLHSSQSLTQQSYTAVVGAGGISQSQNRGYNGSDSQFASLTASVGGGGGGTNVGPTNGASGGSGGGSHASSGGLGGSATSGQGNAGGNYVVSNSGGGGGGAGEAGNTDGGSQGGDGTNAYSSWASATRTGVNGFYAGGGGGGSNNLGNTGAGGDGGGGGNNTPGTRNTGSGGGTRWTGDPTNAGSGGSGIIIVRYEV
jgi:hypothetical protein